VLLTNGWDRHARRRAAEQFGMDKDEMDERHHLTYDTYEVGKISLDTYLDRVVFWKPRAFTREQFRAFMFAQSQPHADVMDLVRRITGKYSLRAGAVTNEGRELTMHRIRAFGLTEFLHFIVASCFVHFRKPDEDIFRIALDIAQVQPERTAYIDDRMLFVEVAAGLGIHAIHHEGLEPTRQALAGLGLTA
jgi:putative hydrolase of the HAD superfamily